MIKRHIVLKQLRKLFEGNGASEFQTPPPIAPNQTEATIFISKAMRLVPYKDELILPQTSLNVDFSAPRNKE